MLARFAQLPAACLLCTDVAARGLDIPDVHWVVQLDPPQNPATFVHRCGRTARAGRAGAALCLLAPHEDSYVHLVACRQVPMTEQAPLSHCAEGAIAADETPEVLADAVCAAARKLAESDRAVMEKATKAFVAHVRGYKEHHCRFIFQLSDLDLNHLGRMLGVLRLPVMKEVRHLRCCLLQESLDRL